jgi:hypothetical protein
VAITAGGVATSAAASLLFFVLFYRSTSPDYRGYVLAALAQGMFIIGAIVAGVVASLPRRSVAACAIAVAFATLIVTGLCGLAHATSMEIVIIVLPCSIASFAGASVGWMVNRRLIPAATPPGP